MATFTLDVYEIDGKRREYTVDEYWECECESGYIHSKFESDCVRCGANVSDCADARLEDLIKYWPLTDEELDTLSGVVLEVTEAHDYESNGGMAVLAAWYDLEVQRAARRLEADQADSISTSERLMNEWLKRE